MATQLGFLATANVREASVHNVKQ